MEFDVAQHGGLDSRKRKQEAGVELRYGGGAGGLGARRLAGQMELGLDLREGERHGARVAVEGEGVNPGASGVAEAEQLGNLVEGFAGGVVEGAADERISPCAVCRTAEIKMCVSAGDDQSQRRLLAKVHLPVVILSERSESKDLRFGLPFMQQHRMDVPFEVVDGDQLQPLGEGQRFGVGDADQQCTGQSRPGGYGDGVQIAQANPRLGQGRAHYRHDSPQMLAAGQLGHDAAITGVGRDLRGHD